MTEFTRGIVVGVLSVFLFFMIIDIGVKIHQARKRRKAIRKFAEFMLSMSKVDFCLDRIDDKKVNEEWARIQRDYGKKGPLL